MYHLSKFTYLSPGTSEKHFLNRSPEGLKAKSLRANGQMLSAEC